jgi:hypothetical protein
LFFLGGAAPTVPAPVRRWQALRISLSAKLV